MTGSTHANHRSARSPRPTPEGPARNNPIAGPRTGTTRSEPSAHASVGASGRHNEPGSGPASACPTQPPSKSGAKAPGMKKGTTASGKPTGAPRATGADEARRTTRGHEARQRGRPSATTTAHGQVPGNNGCRMPQTRTARTTTHTTTAEGRHRRENEAKQRQRDRTPWTGSSGAGQAAGTAAPRTGASRDWLWWTPPGLDHPGRTKQQAPRGAAEAATRTRPWRCSEAEWRTRTGRSGENKMRTRTR